MSDELANHDEPAASKRRWLQILRLRATERGVSDPNPILAGVLLRNFGMSRAERTLIILGAGASRGASFAGATRQLQPPLDADFFAQVQRLDEPDFRKYAVDVVDFIHEEFGPDVLPTLESVFTQLEGFDRFLQDFYPSKGRRPEKFRRQLANLRSLIPVVFRHAMEDQRCIWHERIAHALRKQDAVVSFNYDVLIDDALARQVTGIWSAHVGYGFTAGGSVERWSGQTTPGPLAGDSIRLLKPHGSLHWTAVDPHSETLELSDDPYAVRAADANIIPPTWDKTALSQWPWKPIWQEASRLLQQVRCLVVIGYSVPATDLLSQALIKGSLGAPKSKLRLLVVVNPDRAARARVINLARPGVVSGTRVIEIESLRDFATLLDPAPNEAPATEGPNIQPALVQMIGSQPASSIATQFRSSPPASGRSSASLTLTTPG